MFDNWRIDTLLRDTLDAWSTENWPYTLAFWLAVAAVGGIGARIADRWRQKPVDMGKPGQPEPVNVGDQTTPAEPVDDLMINLSGHGFAEIAKSIEAERKDGVEGGDVNRPAPKDIRSLRQDRSRQ
ncbi:MAG: hypothetical protein AB7S74_01925 [Hyphomicrobium sp.]